MLENEKKHFNGNAWYLQLMERRTRAALRAESKVFEREHAGDSDEALLALVRARAEALGHPPQMCEMTGARMIAARFGSWSAALYRLGYHGASGTRILERSERYRAEYARQQKLYRAERREKNEARMERRRTKKQETRGE